MQPQQPKTERGAQPAEKRDNERTAETAEATESRKMPCPVCGTLMPDLKGGKATICPVCGFKDSCCY